MEQLTALIEGKQLPPDEILRIKKNLLVILKGNFGKLRKLDLTATNYKLHFNGQIEAREMVFKNELLQYSSKYTTELLSCFFRYWSEHTQDGKYMKWEKEKTWELGKRLGTWFSNQQKRGY